MVITFNMNGTFLFSVTVCNNSIFSKSVELLINIFWRSNICTIANLTNRNKWFHTFIQNSLFYRFSYNAIQIWVLTGLCEELLLLDSLYLKLISDFIYTKSFSYVLSDRCWHFIYTETCTKLFFIPGNGFTYNAWCNHFNQNMSIMQYYKIWEETSCSNHLHIIIQFTSNICGHDLNWIHNIDTKNHYTWWLTSTSYSISYTT